MESHVFRLTVFHPMVFMSIPRAPYVTSLVLLLLGSLAWIPSSRGDVRSYDGSGNNLDHPSWGQAATPFARMDSQAHYPDGVGAAAGPTRPNPRDVSNALGVQTQLMPNTRGLSNYAWVWGQFIDHDITLNHVGSESMPILVTDPEDPLTPRIPFTRSAYEMSSGVREQLNETSSFIDASMIYGAHTNRATQLRSGVGGQMQISDNGLLPRNLDEFLPMANEGIEPDSQLFIAGDVRANEHAGLTAMHTLWVREHNRLAQEFATSEYGQADLHDPAIDESIYQETRRYVGALVQSITFEQYLPAILGSAAPDLESIAYDAQTDPRIRNEFATAAYRLGHTQVSPTLPRRMPEGQLAPGGDWALKNAFFKPSLFTTGADVDYLLQGFASELQQEIDVRLIDDLRMAMFGEPGHGGMDLFAINLQRGRDHGLPTYNQMRSVMQMPVAADFDDITSEIGMQQNLVDLYENVDELDLWTGALLEPATGDAAVGPLLEHILTDQFTRLMAGDRMFFLWDDQLTVDQLSTIRNTSLADVIQRNSTVRGLQANVFFVPEPSAIATLLVASLLFARAGLARRRHTRA